MLTILPVTKKNGRSYLRDFIEQLNIFAVAKDPDFVQIQPNMITNKLDFKQWNKFAPLTVYPPRTYKKYKGIRLNYQRAQLTDLKYQVTPRLIYYTAQRPNSDLLFQINALFNTNFHPSEPNVRVYLKDPHTITLEITDDFHMMFEKGELDLPATDASFTLAEICQSQEVILSKADMDFAINLFSLSTTKRKEQTITFNAFDSFMMAIALREVEKTETRDELRDYSFEKMPHYHKLSVANRIQFGHDSPKKFTPVAAETPEYNSYVKIKYVPTMTTYPEKRENVVTVKYRRQRIGEYCQRYFGLPNEPEILKIREPNVNDLSDNTTLIAALKRYLNFNTTVDVVDVLGNRYENDILVERRNNDIYFNFQYHPLFIGSIRVDFGD